MSDITIKLSEDPKTGRIHIEANPTWRQLIDKHQSGHKLSNSEETALFAMTHILKRARGEEKKMITEILKHGKDLFRK